MSGNVSDGYSVASIFSSGSTSTKSTKSTSTSTSKSEWNVKSVLTAPSSSDSGVAPRSQSQSSNQSNAYSINSLFSDSPSTSSSSSSESRGGRSRHPSRKNDNVVLVSPVEPSKITPDENIVGYATKDAGGNPVSHPLPKPMNKDEFKQWQEKQKINYYRQQDPALRLVPDSQVESEVKSINQEYETRQRLSKISGEVHAAPKSNNKIKNWWDDFILRHSSPNAHLSTGDVAANALIGGGEVLKDTGDSIVNVGKLTVGAVKQVGRGVDWVFHNPSKVKDAAIDVGIGAVGLAKKGAKKGVEYVEHPSHAVNDFKSAAVDVDAAIGGGIALTNKKLKEEVGIKSAEFQSTHNYVGNPAGFIRDLVHGVGDFEVATEGVKGAANKVNDFVKDWNGVDLVGYDKYDVVSIDDGSGAVVSVKPSADANVVSRVRVRPNSIDSFGARDVKGLVKNSEIFDGENVVGRGKFGFVVNDARGKVVKGFDIANSPIDDVVKNDKFGFESDGFKLLTKPASKQDLTVTNLITGKSKSLRGFGKRFGFLETDEGVKPFVDLNPRESKMSFKNGVGIFDVGVKEVSTAQQGSDIDFFIGSFKRGDSFVTFDKPLMSPVKDFVKADLKEKASDFGKAASELIKSKKGSLMLKSITKQKEIVNPAGKISQKFGLFESNDAINAESAVKGVDVGLGLSQLVQVSKKSRKDNSFGVIQPFDWDVSPIISLDVSKTSKNKKLNLPSHIFSTKIGGSEILDTNSSQSTSLGSSQQLDMLSSSAESNIVSVPILDFSGNGRVKKKKKPVPIDFKFNKLSKKKKRSGFISSKKSFFEKKNPWNTPSNVLNMFTKTKKVVVRKRNGKKVKVYKAFGGIL